MTSLFIVLCFCLILITVHGSNSRIQLLRKEKEKRNVLKNRLDANGAKINGALRISPNSYLGEGTYGLVYRGIRIKDSRPVAVKIVNEFFESPAYHEYAIYSYLHAIDNSTVERYGIPAVYYYANWEDFIVTAITLCEGSLTNRKDDFASPLNALIVFQQFVRQSKYLHSHGVRHDDIKPDNILVRSYQTFLIDYNLGSKMNEDEGLCSYWYKPRKSHLTKQTRKGIDDWESFFYSISQLCGVSFKWFSGDEYKDLSLEELDQKYGEAKKDTKDIFKKIENIESIPLKNVFKAFAKEIFSEDAKDFPNYDCMDKYISDQINSVLTPNQPIFFTWMQPKDVKQALKHIRMNSIPNIHTNIRDPSQFNFIYPDVDEDHFSRNYKKFNIGALCR